jgi:hypothetical protein
MWNKVESALSGRISIMRCDNTGTRCQSLCHDFVQLLVRRNGIGSLRFTIWLARTDMAAAKLGDKTCRVLAGLVRSGYGILCVRQSVTLKAVKHLQIRASKVCSEVC